MKNFEDVWVDELENFEKNYKEDIERDHALGPTKWSGLMKHLRKVFAVALPVITTATMATVLVACEPSTPTPPKPDDQHQHSLTHVAAKAESCDTDGMKEHWDCDSCGKTFSDSKAEHEVDKDSLVIKAHHTLTHQTEKKATCTADGNIDYYHCTACGENFLDANGENKVALDDTIVESQGHVVGTQWERDKNGHWKTCSACGEKVNYSAHNFKNYVCQDCGLELQTELSDSEKIQYIENKIQSNIKKILGRTAELKDCFAIDFKVENNENVCYLLVNYSSSIVSNGLSLISIPMTTQMSDENIKNQTLAPKSSTAGKVVLNMPYGKQSELVPQILDKLSIDEKFDYVGIENRGGGFSVELGGNASRFYIYLLNDDCIQSVTLNIKTNNGTITDKDTLINKHFLNGIIGEDYTINDPENPVKIEFDFSDNAIFNFNGLNSTRSVNQEETQEM